MLTSWPIVRPNATRERPKGENMNKLELLTHSLKVLTALSDDIQKAISNAQEGVEKGSSDLIIGSLCGMDQTALHIKNIYEMMLSVHQK